MKLRLLFCSTICALAISVSSAQAGINLALGADASASDNGWGGGSSKSDLTDGLKSYAHWAHGLAAPFGQSSFQMTIDFGQLETFDTVVAWWHPAPTRAPNIIDIQAWNGLSWDTVYSTTNGLSFLGEEDNSNGAGSQSMALTFAAVTADKVRMVYDNAEIYARAQQHGWAYEVEVFNMSPVPEPGTLTMWSFLGATGLVFTLRRRRNRRTAKH